jgi:LPXTG-motif cell wall-anchored protein
LGATDRRSVRGSGKSRPGAKLVPLGTFLVAAALASLVLAAPAAAEPANEEYNLDLPEATDSGSGDGDTAPEAVTTTPAPETGTDESAAPVDTQDYSEDVDASGAVAGDSSGNGGAGSKGDSKTDDASGHGPGNAGGERAHSIPAIAADGAGNSGVWLLLLGLALVLALAGYLIYKRRRPRQLEA